ncbi:MULTISPECIES: DUF1707 SHOCT-like domain-containing protein [Streptomycetaceae]|uniref:Cell wall-active antibiotics response LiaF-like C-terminal domain-containing protein n=1 Tax=Streptantibioticus cattleyicolor (strain ATCC 35852 / DSM 46488 / JCM 4925 / NBRC 14057 / NRRL 8057) TaxID=1003195 RepID=F8JPM5_STREN|nr:MULTISPECIES: DUF1707 domain-containing protein [Streptomycetaceae]AEW92717.1 protein of unknown function DUF1707 [Streptantibioticus cattleyicolor NRRL 8057 = DSM 46488]MYS57483.1 DUF1707 domain-containing protein [Streptomyces sp. SID5468]CCB73071.1 conserved protein of unknown function [Streptantibioticus cattleyicolor NRRL 8057 = DSM 46488]
MAARPELDLRASDAERDRVAAVLADALAGGLLDPAEHAERLEAVYAARTRGQLAPVTADLPEPAAGADLTGHLDTGPVQALFSKIRRGGQWPVPPLTVVRSRFGAVVIDLRHAVFTRREVVIDAGSFCGKIEILVPEDAQVYDTGTALFGKRSQPGGDGPVGEGGPVVRITGRSVLGHVRVMRGGFKYPWRDWS